MSLTRGTVGELLASTGDGNSKKQPKKSGAAKKKGKKKKGRASLPRLWMPQGEYVIIRRGVELSKDPNDYGDQIQERTMFLFKHTDPDVQFNKDPKRPLYVGVFKINAKFGYGKDQYYLPTNKHYHTMYARDMPKKNQPADNMVRTRVGKEYPYWVDAWQKHKNEQSRHKKKSRTLKKTAEAASDPLPPLPADATAEALALKEEKRKKKIYSIEQDATVIPVDEKYIFRLSGWMENNVKKRKGGHDPIISSTMLRTSPAIKLSKDLLELVSQMGKQDAVSNAQKQRNVIINAPEPLYHSTDPLHPVDRYTGEPLKSKEVKKPKRQRKEPSARAAPVVTKKAKHSSSTKIPRIMKSYAEHQESLCNSGKLKQVHPLYASYWLGKDDGCNSIEFFDVGNAGSLLLDFQRFQNE